MYHIIFFVEFISTKLIVIDETGKVYDSSVFTYLSVLNINEKEKKILLISFNNRLIAFIHELIACAVTQICTCFVCEEGTKS